MARVGCVCLFWGWIWCGGSAVVSFGSITTTQHNTPQYRLTAEEKAARLAAMQQDGHLNEEKRRERVQRGMERERAEDAQEAGMTVEAKAKASTLAKEMRPEFLQKMGAEAYMGGGETLEERMEKLKHTRQRRADEGGFL
jgi:hypothetical protein